MTKNRKMTAHWAGELDGMLDWPDPQDINWRTGNTFAKDMDRLITESMLKDIMSEEDRKFIETAKELRGGC